MDDDAFLAQFAHYQAASNCRPDTIKERAIALRALCRRSGKPLATMHRHDLIADLGREGLKGRTRQNYRSLYHTFFTWMQDEEYRIDNPAARLPRVRVEHQEPNPFETGEVEFLLNSGIYGKTRMYVLLYTYQAFRPVEIAAVSSDTIDWARRRILSSEGKGGKEVWRPIHPIVWDELQKYPRDGWLFPSPSGEGHVGRKNVSNVLSRAIKRAGFVGHKPHNFRAWHATELLDAGVPTAVAIASLRQSDGQSIRHYQLVRERVISEAMSKLPSIEVPERSGRRQAA